MVKDKNGFEGDNDPLDICELSDKPITTGEVRKVKILGALELID
jgi:inorganic pyrophosphatase